MSNSRRSVPYEKHAKIFLTASVAAALGVGAISLVRRLQQSKSRSDTNSPDLKRSSKWWEYVAASYIYIRNRKK